MKKLIIPGVLLLSLNSINAQTKNLSNNSVTIDNNSYKNSPKQNVSNEIINDLFKHKLINDTNNVSFSLDNEEFTVNRKTMERKVQLRYRNKYRLTKGTKITCSKSNK
jgi:hypothetical protein